MRCGVVLRTQPSCVCVCIDACTPPSPRAHAYVRPTLAKMANLTGIVTEVARLQTAYSLAGRDRGYAGWDVYRTRNRRTRGERLRQHRHAELQHQYRGEQPPVNARQPRHGRAHVSRWITGNQQARLGVAATDRGSPHGHRNGHCLKCRSWIPY